MFICFCENIDMLNKFSSWLIKSFKKFRQIKYTDFAYCAASQRMQLQTQVFDCYYFLKITISHDHICF